MCLEPVIYRYEDVLLADGSYYQKPTIMYPCGKCIVCKEKKRRQWALRMLSENTFHKSAYFVTLTYSDENLEFSDAGFPTLSKVHYKNFLRRFKYNLGFAPRFFGCGEYGSESFRPHYHFIFYFDSAISRNQLYDIVASVWDKGFVTVKKANYGRFYYISKYVVKDSETPITCLPPFQTQSQRPPLGWQFVEDNISKFRDLSRNYIESPSFVKTSLPRSFEDKIKSYLGEPLKRKYILQKNASYRLRNYVESYNKLPASTILDMQRNIERRYKEKKLRKLNKI